MNPKTRKCVCECDTYCKMPTEFSSVEEFIDMCGSVFGEYPTLTSRIGVNGLLAWYDEKGQRVLCEKD
jgi:hypothetical protein